MTIYKQNYFQFNYLKAYVLYNYYVYNNFKKYLQVNFISTLSVMLKMY